MTGREGARRRREADQAAWEQTRREAEEERDRVRLAAQWRQEGADRKRAAVAGQIAELADLLAARPPDLRSRGTALEEAFSTDGPAAFSALVETLLAESPYPVGFPRTVRVLFVAESRELLIDYDLSRQDVIPDNDASPRDEPVVLAVWSPAASALRASQGRSLACRTDACRLVCRPGRTGGAAQDDRPMRFTSIIRHQKRAA